MINVGLPKRPSPKELLKNRHFVWNGPWETNGAEKRQAWQYRYED